jgi:hypothetical protein
MDHVTSEPKDKQGISMDSAVAGLLALLVDGPELRVKDDKTAVKTEVLLSHEGLSIDDIAAVTDKKYDAVRLSLSRASKK